MQLEQISPEVALAQMRVGEPIPFDCYDAGGRLLLKKGLVVRSAEQRDALVDRGLYADLELLHALTLNAGDNLSTREQIEGLQDTVSDLFERVLQGRFDGTRASVVNVASDLQKIADGYADPMLAAIHLPSSRRHEACHAVCCGALIELLGRRRNLDATLRHDMIAGSLVAGIANSREQLPKLRPEAEPAYICELMMEMDVDNPAWYDTVLFSRERNDGSGFLRMSPDNTPMGARMLAMIDVYATMVTPPPGRPVFSAKSAMQQLYARSGNTFDSTLVGMFIKEVGIYPPGSVVRLQNGDVALVVRRGANARAPYVKSVLGPRGGPLERPIERDTSVPQYEIRDALIVQDMQPQDVAAVVAAAQ